MKKRCNPLSYLGWLGLVGLVGLWAGAPSLMLFLLFFFFFAYCGMTPDELFWANVRKAGLRAFAVHISLTCLLTLLLNGRGIYFSFTNPDALPMLPTAPVADIVSMPWIQYEQISISIFGTNLAFTMSICTFMFTLMYFNHKEKAYAREDDPC